MRYLLLCILLSFTILADNHDWDVTSGIVRRNWSLQKNKLHVGWFSSKEACDTWRKLFYKESEMECILKQ